MRAVPTYLLDQNSCGAKSTCITGWRAGPARPTHPGTPRALPITSVYACYYSRIMLYANAVLLFSKLFPHNYCKPTHEGMPMGEASCKEGGLFQVFVHLPTKSTYVCLLNDPQLHHPAEVEKKSIEQAVMYSGAASLQSSFSRRAQHCEWQHAMALV